MVSTTVWITRTKPDLPFFVETIPYCFWLRREDRQMPPEVYYQKISQYSQENTCVEASFSTLLRLQHRCSPVNIGTFLKNLFWRTFPYASFWRDFTKWLIRTFFLKRRFQNHPDLVILQKYQSLSNQNPL